MEKLKHTKEIYSKLVENGTSLGNTFSKNVNLLKDYYGFTIQEIADGCELPIETVKAIIYYENKDYKLSSLSKMATFFNLSMEELCGSPALNIKTLESIQKLRMLEGKYNYFLYAMIEWMYQENKNDYEKSVPVYAPKCDPSTGSLKYDIRCVSKPLDISNVADGIKPKIVMALKIPCNHYAPFFYENDYLLLAKDRNPNPDETVVVIMNGYIWLCNIKITHENGNVIKGMYSLIDGHFCGNIKSTEQVLGYVVQINV